MSKDIIQESIIGLALLFLLALGLNPLGLWMPSMLQLIIIGGLLIVFALFVSFVWKEKARDEREQLHRAFAGRLAFLAGMSALIVGIIVQLTQHHLDHWLVVTLAAMIIAKVVALLYSERYH